MPKGARNSLSVLITRPEPGAARFAAAVQGLGLMPIVAPMLQIRQRSEVSPPKEFALEDTDAVIFVSVPAVEFGTTPLQRLDLSARQVFAVGSTTAGAIKKHFSGNMPRRVRVPAEGFNSEAVLALPELQAPGICSKNVLIVRGVGGREMLATELRARGARVAYLEVYERAPTNLRIGEILADAGVTVPSIGVVTSVESFEQLSECIQSEGLNQLFAMPILVSGARIAREARRLGFTNPPQIADNPTQEFLIASLEHWALEQL